ncbi:hypothetical protein C0J52_12035 [Blattella germanica]|nr:hypothetical protein C0J52_12035 [Blattella germanica]
MVQTHIPDSWLQVPGFAMIIPPVFGEHFCRVKSLAFSIFITCDSNTGTACIWVSLLETRVDPTRLELEGVDKLSAPSSSLDSLMVPFKLKATPSPLRKHCSTTVSSA